MSRTFTFCLLAFSAVATAQSDESRWTLRLEGSTAQTIRNDVRVPGVGGTDFSLKSFTGTGPSAVPTRTELIYRSSPDTEWRLLIAPLGLAGRGTLTGPTVFRNTTFAAGAASARYEFNSYRLSYRRKWKQTDSSEWFFGYTLKVRNARIQLSQGLATELESDPTGVVPLLSLSGRERISDRWFADFDVDGLAAPQGRAFDIGARIHYKINPQSSAFVGARILEGGASNDKVFSFAQFHYLMAGMQLRF